MDSQNLTTQAAPGDIEAARRLGEARRCIESEVEKVIIGQKAVVEQVLICLLAHGHGLLIGVPGLAKTLLINTLAQVLELSFKRVQFTPDLMPSDITGTDILEEDQTTGKRAFRFVPGPVFANVVLADEINRTPPKTQAALLQAMQEYKVTVSGHTYNLPAPFFVLATQNPIELEGTYPLPEAQLDRFMFSIYVDYPAPDEEREIVKTTTSAYVPDLAKVLSANEVTKLAELVRRVPVADDVIDYAVRLASSTRPVSENSPGFIKEWVSWGAGPRASQYLILGAKTKALLDGSYTPTTEDIRTVAQPVLRHRIVTNFTAEAEGIKPKDIIDRLVKEL
ncbi:AAA family ATPase [candidate division WOR-3 bacterium JGI_Cruoil_03_51_56]|uniref:AAA family ATPase n=1 Tax=candidate division WOR-3 bacterium JGI_Cruoil_03_51_56 TaxID=1973747 RepID=A0A235BX16_UNCW3|nr:MAG: AAA family ATPase [candidate division WOR-3 bacterium JGI_Cruoil_03_51_56]